MRKLDELANRKFNGDVKKTLLYLLRDSNDEKMDDYIPELTQTEADFVYDAMREDAIKFYGSEQNFRRETKKNVILDYLELSEEEVRNAPVNPYKAQFFKSIFKFLVLEGGVLALTVAAPTLGLPASVLGLGASIVTGMSALTLSSNLMKYLRFKQASKLVAKQDEELKKTEAERKGRGM